MAFKFNQVKAFFFIRKYFLIFAYALKLLSRKQYKIIFSKTILKIPNKRIYATIVTERIIEEQ